MQSAIAQLKQGRSLEFQQASEILQQIMAGRHPTAPIVEFLKLLHAKGETVDELAGAAAALQSKMAAIQCDRTPLIDTCGTGGSGKHLFNVSTAAAFVVAAAGVAVAKHGNRAITGKTGSADVLQELGVKVDASLDLTERCLNELGICFCFAPLFHPSVKYAAEARKQIEHPTLFNLLGPLCNPARAPYQLLGAGRGETRQLLAEALARLGTTRSAVVHGSDGIGEVTIAGPTFVSLVEADQVRDSIWNTGHFGIEPAATASLRVNSARDSAAIIRGVLDNRPGPALDIVLTNSAAALQICDVADSLNEGMDQARKVVAEGTAAALLDELVTLSHTG